MSVTDLLLSNFTTHCSSKLPSCGLRCNLSTLLKQGFLDVEILKEASNRIRCFLGKIKNLHLKESEINQVKIHL